MKAIVTKFHGATGARGSRISATDSDGNRVSIGYPHELHRENIHAAAALALCKKMKWTGELIEGSLKGSSRVFVWANGQRITATGVTQ